MLTHVRQGDFKPSGLPPELLKVWQRHDDERERCHMEWQGGSMRHEALWHRHDAVCEALESIGARARDRDMLRSLEERVRALPVDCGYYEMRDAVTRNAN